MKSKRGSNKIYYYIDLFFILLPILILIGTFIYNICVLKMNGVLELFIDEGFGLWELFCYPVIDYMNNDAGIFNIPVTNIFYSFFNYAKQGDSIASYINSFIEEIFNILGLISNDQFGNENYIFFIQGYFTYLTCYEIFSLLFNILMWLLRWARNKVRDWIGSDSI